MGDLKMISINDSLFTVGGNAKTSELNIGIAYIIEGLVLPYFGEAYEYELANLEEVGFYKIRKEKRKRKNGITFELKKFHVIRPDENDIENYSVDKIRHISIEDMLTDDDVSNKIVNETSMDADIYSPVILSKDDLAMKVFKYILNKKSIDFKNYNHRFNKAYGPNNTKRMIDIGGTMKISKLEELADIFDFGFVIGIYDKSKTKIPNPINKDGSKKMYVINYGKGIPLSEYELINIMDE